MTRSDALKNREHLLEVAHDAFAENGATSLNEIAKRAGVGPGTLYRHFPTREALILAVYRHDVLKLVGSVDAVLAAHRPLEALVAWFETLARYIRVKHGLGEALHSAAIRDAINETYAPVVGAVDRLLQACVVDGSIRADVDASDLLLLMGFLWRVEDSRAGVARGRRLTALVLDGLRNPPVSKRATVERRAAPAPRRKR